MARPQGIEVSYADIYDQVKSRHTSPTLRRYGLKEFLKQVGMSYRQRDYLRISNRISKMNAAKMYILGDIQGMPLGELTNEIDKIYKSQKRSNKNPGKRK